MKLIIMGANWLLFLLNGVFLDSLIDIYWYFQNAKLFRIVKHHIVHGMVTLSARNAMMTTFSSRKWHDLQECVIFLKMTCQENNTF